MIYNNKPKILSPAGNIEKLKFAVTYGADGVFFGGEKFNLRDKAGNFTFEEIEEAVDYCQKRGVETIFLLNSFLHESDIAEAEDYIKKIKKFRFNGIMVSDPGMLAILKEQDVQVPIHISTQMSTLNHKTIKLWESLGVKRVVLAREVSLEEIKEIRKHSNIELEVFVHGALCISYSGRCLLSRFLSGRDANHGACSQPCRWKYHLVEEKRLSNHMDIIEHSNSTEILSSKDLCLIKQIPEYIKAGVNAFKLEGRMKSIYYTANITRIYKNAVEAFLKGENIENLIPFWEKELDMVSHRPYTEDLFNEFNGLEFDGIPYIDNRLFLGYFVRQGNLPNEAFIKIHNPIRINDEIESIYPITNNNILDNSLKVLQILKEDESETDMGRPTETVLVKFDKPIKPDAILRMIKE